MITVNGIEIERKHFPDNTQMLLNVNLDYLDNSYYIRWEYNNDEELVLLMFLVKHLKNLNKKATYVLSMPYIPNARMDRTKNKTEIFTLKYFCEIINSLEFDMVEVLDPHSNVSKALLNRVGEIPLTYVFERLNKDIDCDYVYFPDESAKKRYEEHFVDKTLIYGKKKRDWKTGEILGIEICNDNNIHTNCKEKISLTGKNILIVDDIISKGGSIYYGLKSLIESCGTPKTISIYASHVESSILEGSLYKEFLATQKATVYTTNSIDRGSEDGNVLGLQIIKI